MKQANARTVAEKLLHIDRFCGSSWATFIGDIQISDEIDDKADAVRAVKELLPVLESSLEKAGVKPAGKMKQ